MNPIIKSAIKHRPTEHWIQNQSNLAWLKLDIEVPAVDIFYEVEKIKSYFVNHRDNDRQLNYQHQGWKSLTLYGVNPWTTTTGPGPYNWTDIIDQCPVTKQFIETYWEINSSTGRIRFMLLESNGHIMPHEDRLETGLKESNVAITHPANCEFRFVNHGTIPFSSGDAFIIDTSKQHLVYNNSMEHRIHIIVHSQLKPGIISRSYEQSFYN